MEVSSVIREYSGKMRKAYESGGFPLLLTRVLRKACHTAFQANNALWFARDLTLPIAEMRSRIPVEVSWDSHETLEWIKHRGLTGSPERKQELETALQESHYFPSVMYEGAIIGYIKLGRGKVYIMDFNMDMCFPEGTAFIYDTYVVPPFRGSGIGSFLITETINFLRFAGYERVMCHIPKWNVASIKAYSKCSFEPIKRIWYFRILGKRWFSTHPQNFL